MTKWRLRRDGKIYGPYTGSQVQDFRQKGHLSLQDELQKEGESRWQPAAKFPGLEMSRKKRFFLRLAQVAGTLMLFALAAATFFLSVSFFFDRLSQQNEPLEVQSLYLEYQEEEDEAFLKLAEPIDRETKRLSATVQLSPPQRETILEVIWLWQDQEQVFHTNRKTLSPETESAHFECPRPEAGWPEGQYRVEVWHDEQLLTSAGYEVAGGTKLRHRFEDDFSQPDLDGWSFEQSRSGRALSFLGASDEMIRYESDGLVLRQALQHEGPAIRLATFPVRPGDVLTIERQLSHYPLAGRRYQADLELHAPGQEEAILSVSSWQNSQPATRPEQGTVFRATRPLLPSDEVLDEEVLPLDLQQSFFEQIIYDSGRGIATYYVDGEKMAEITGMEAFSQDAMHLAMGLAGHGTDHQLHVQSFSIEVHRP